MIDFATYTPLAMLLASILKLCSGWLDKRWSANSAPK
jgi:hypothetical protein